MYAQICIYLAAQNIGNQITAQKYASRQTNRGQGYIMPCAYMRLVRVPMQRGLSVNTISTTDNKV